MSENRSEHWLYRLLRQHPALLVSGLYVVASTIGMLFSWDYLRRFGIDVFNYAQIGDFLLASLKEPMTWGLVALATLLVVADNSFSRRWQRKERSAWTSWYGSRRYRQLNYIVALIMVVLFIDIYATWKARNTYAGDGEMVEYQLSDSTEKKAATILGTTTQFVFFYDANTRMVYVHPNESIGSISFVAPGRN